MQDFIVGPFDQTIKMANFPVLSSIIGLAYEGGTPFQAEIYFINLARIIQVKFGVPFFDVYDPRLADFGVVVSGIDIGVIEIDKTSEDYRQLMAVTKNIVAVKIEAETQDYVERLRIQREEGQYAMHKQSQASNIGAFQVEKQAEVGGANDFESTDSPNMWGISRWEKSVRFMMWK